ncbi:MAG: hypothetical protein ACK52U_16060 [Synechococcaceae cyanobacterium]
MTNPGDGQRGAPTRPQHLAALQAPPLCRQPCRALPPAQPGGYRIATATRPQGPGRFRHG